MIANYWPLVLKSMKVKAGVGQFRTWVSTLKFVQIKDFGKKIVLEVKSLYHKDYVDRKLKPDLLDCIKKYYPSVVGIEYQVICKNQMEAELAGGDSEKNNKNSSKANIQKGAENDIEGSSVLSQNDGWVSSSITLSDEDMNPEDSLSGNTKAEGLKNNLDKNSLNDDQNQLGSSDSPYSNKSNKGSKFKDSLEDGSESTTENNYKSPKKYKNNNTTAFEFGAKEEKQEELPKFMPSSNISGLNPRLTFENFVIGSFNELAGSVAKSIAKKPGTLYNPVFIHSDVGLGKTHLLHAIGNQILEYTPNFKIRYTTCEKFFNHYIQALNNKNMEAFRNYYRDIDVLLMDDIQFLAGKESTQEVFFHTFNEIHSQGKQIVITSDISPQELSLKSVAARLVSRFQWGIVVDMIKPNLEDRQAIIEFKLSKIVEDSDLQLTKSQVLKLASSLDGSVRDIEGSINRLVAQIQIQKQKNQKKGEIVLKSTKNILNSGKNSLSAEDSIKLGEANKTSQTGADGFGTGAASNQDSEGRSVGWQTQNTTNQDLEKSAINKQNKLEAYGNFDKNTEPKNMDTSINRANNKIEIDIDKLIGSQQKNSGYKQGRSQAMEIMHKVLDYYGISESAIMSKMRSKQVSTARQVIMYLLKTKLNWSYLDIARFFNRDHTTIMHGYQKAESILRQNPEILSLIGV